MIDESGAAEPAGILPGEAGLPETAIPASLWPDAELLWRYHQLDHQLCPAEVALALGSHDLGVADWTAELFRRALVPLIVASGGSSATTRARFPLGEAVHYRERLLDLGVPDEAILVEPQARHTGENLMLSRALLARHGVVPATATIVCRPYQQRRAWATAAALWPELTVLCTSQPSTLADYVATIGDPALVIAMLVGDTQRIWLHARRGHAVVQPVPGEVRAAYDQLVAAGYTARLLPE